MRPIIQQLLALVLLALPAALAGCAAPAPQPAPDVQVHDAEHGTVTATRRGTALLIEVTSDTGIGRAAVTLPAAADAARGVILRLHLRGLESLTFTYAEGAVQVSVPSSGAPLVRETFTPAGATSPSPIARGSPYWMDVGILSNDPAATPAIPLANGYFDITVPGDFLHSGQTEFEIAWVDFYR